MIPEPHPYDPDDPTYDEATDDLGYLLPDRGYRGDVMDPVDPLEYSPGRRRLCPSICPHRPLRRGRSRRCRRVRDGAAGCARRVPVDS